MVDKWKKSVSPKTYRNCASSPDLAPAYQELLAATEVELEEIFILGRSYYGVKRIGRYIRIL